MKFYKGRNDKCLESYTLPFFKLYELVKRFEIIIVVTEVIDYN